MSDLQARVLTLAIDLSGNLPEVTETSCPHVQFILSLVVAKNEKVRLTREVRTIRDNLNFVLRKFSQSAMK